MDAIARNSSIAPPSVRSSVDKVPTIYRSSSACRHSKSGIGWPELGGVSVRSIRRKRWSTEQGSDAPSWQQQLRHELNFSLLKADRKRNACGSSRISWDGFWVCHEVAPGSQAFVAAASSGRRKVQQSCKAAAHGHYRDHNSKRSSVFAKLEQRANVCGKKEGNELARGALKANAAEVSSSREETSGAIDTQQATKIGGFEGVSTSTFVLDREPITGGTLDFRGATLPLSTGPLVATKKIFLVRHGLSTWNTESRIQGSSDLSKLSEAGIAQGERCKQALANLKFNACYASPISRARTSAEVIWSGREEPIVFMDSLKEAHLLILEGMLNVDAKEQYPELYNTWREDPVKFHVGGVYPLQKVWAQAKEAWREILSAEADLVLVVTHKSILRALLCTALGMGPERFRAVDINNGGISVFNVNKRGEPMLQCLNMTAHLHVDGVFY